MPDTGAPWNIPYVAGTDLVSDWPTDSQTLAEAIADGLDTANLGLGSNVVQTVKTDTFSTTSTSYTPLTGLSVSITPTSASSKVMVFVNVGLSVRSTAGNVKMVLKRDSTQIAVPDSPGSRQAAFTAPQFDYSGGGDSILQFAFHYLDSPSTTSSTTYSVDIQTSASTIYVNRGLTDTDNASFARTVSTITAIEVAA